jgi:hypothetical protein
VSAEQAPPTPAREGEPPADEPVAHGDDRSEPDEARGQDGRSKAQEQAGPKDEEEVRS